MALAQRHKRYGVGMIHLKLRQEGLRVNYKRVERLHARTEIERWRRDYNAERPKKALGGLTPAAYAKQLK